MSIVKSFSVGVGDMFYIKHNSSNFTIIDCFLNDDNKQDILNEIIEQKKDKDIVRFISTHPDEDHIKGLEFLDAEINLLNFYCVENSAIKPDKSDSFDHYCKLRDSEEYHYYVYKGCKRKWMNENEEEDGKNYGSSGINFLWPITDNEEYKKVLQNVTKGKDYNNLSPVFTYQANNVKIMWMGDMEHTFLEKIKDKVKWPKVDILFAPHHGRDSGKVSSDVLDKLDPYIIIIGEGPSENLNYYSGYNTITQNSAGDIVFECVNNRVNIYISNEKYQYDVSFLENDSLENKELGHYIGSFTSNLNNK